MLYLNVPLCNSTLNIWDRFSSCVSIIKGCMTIAGALVVLHNSVKCQDKCGTAFLIQFFWQYFQVVQHFSWQGVNLSAVHTFIFSVKVLLKFRDRTGDGPIFRSTEQKYNSPIRRVSNRIIAATVLWFITGDYFLTRHCIFYEKVRRSSLCNRGAQHCMMFIYKILL